MTKFYKIISKQSFKCVSTNAYFTKDETYYYFYNQNIVFNKYMVPLWQSELEYDFDEALEFLKFFYTEKEYRKLKLDKINEDNL